MHTNISLNSSIDIFILVFRQRPEPEGILSHIKAIQFLARDAILNNQYFKAKSMVKTFINFRPNAQV